MSNKTNSKNNTNTIILIIIAVLLAFFAGFLINKRSNNNNMGSMMNNSQNRQYSQNEIMFAAMMVPHHEQALIMSNFALTNTTNPGILDLAQRIKAGQEPEIAQMNTWLDGANSMMDHSGHQMGGMLSDEDLAKLETLKDKEFDEMFLKSMIEHHEGAIQMTQMILNSSNSEVKTLADNIVSSQTKEIAEMKELLAKLN